MSLTTFNNIIGIWIPIIHSFETLDVQETKQIAKLLSEYSNKFHSAFIFGISRNQSFCKLNLLKHNYSE